ncbi:MAG TPA: FtsX-like permease family protein [Candidatus Aminicenantes bacterium]|nr:FtsX-like permease family protein [Candidatus Aminicenantes bacterium]
MIRFLLKGILRDRSRSLLPFLTICFGVMLTVVLYSWMKGAEANIAESSARFDYGHLKIMTRAYAEEAELIPNELALVGVSELMAKLAKDFPQIEWTPRIKFGGLLDLPDEKGETLVQAPISGLAVNLLNPPTPEKDILNLENALARGRLPQEAGEALLSEELAQRLGIKPGSVATIISQTMTGSLALANLRFVGTIRFGIQVLDAQAILIDLADAQRILDMVDASGEILGFFKDGIFRQKVAEAIVNQFNASFSQSSDRFSPIMKSLLDQGGLADLLAMVQSVYSIIIFVFVLAMSVVLWNAGLMGNIRRFGEIGVRLAMGEDKGHLYRSLISESLIIGCLGSIVGTLGGLGIAYYLQVKGVNVASIMESSSIFISEVMRARITWFSAVVGFIPGLGATLIGSTLSALGVYRRQTSGLMKELEAY